MNPLLLMLAMGGARGGMAKMLPLMLLSGGLGAGVGAAPAGLSPMLMMAMMGGGGIGRMLPMLALSGALPGVDPMMAMLMSQNMGTSTYRRRRTNWRSQSQYWKGRAQGASYRRRW